MRKDTYYLSFAFAPILLLISSVYAIHDGSWISHDDLEYKNYSCPFEIVNWNGWALGDDKEAESCGRLRYVPKHRPSNYTTKIDPRIFKLFNNKTIYFLGDSMILEQVVDFSCRFQKYLKHKNLIDAGTSKSTWCGWENMCVSG